MKSLLVIILCMAGYISFSQEIQDFTLVNIADGKNVSLKSFTNCQGIAVIFTSNECPYDEQYRQRIKDLNEKYRGTIQFLLINAHQEARENAKAMAQKYAGWGMSIPYLSDKDQIAMDCLGAKKSPEAFLLKKNGQSFTIVYQGSIDDNPLVNTDVDKAYLNMAIDQMLANKKVEVTDNRVAGCTIRKRTN